MIQSARSSAGLEQQPSKLWVGGSSPSGQANNCAHGGIGRHNRLKICRRIRCAGSSPAGGTNYLIYQLFVDLAGL